MENTLTPKQTEALIDWTNPDIRELAYGGGARSGKSWLVCRVLIERALAFPNSRHLICRFKGTHLKRNLYKQTFLPVLKTVMPVSAVKINEIEMTVKFHNGAEIIMSGLDDKERTEAVIMGSEYNTIFINEAVQITYSVFQDIKSRMSMRVPGLNNLVVLDFNPRNTHHWIYKYFYIGKDPITSEPVPEAAGRFTRNWIPEDNTYLDPEYIRTQLDTLSGAKKDRLRYGKWANLEGLVYPMFDKCIIKPIAINPEWPVLVGIDFGYFHKFTAGFWAYDKDNEKLYKFKEYSAVQKTIPTIAPILIDLGILDAELIVTDHSAGDRAQLEEAGIFSVKANKDVMAGVNVLSSLLDGSYGVKLLIFDTCPGTIEEGVSYEYDDKKGVPRKIDNQDDFMDEDRYLGMGFVEHYGSGEILVSAV